MAAYDHSKVAHFIGQSSSCLAIVTNGPFIALLGGNSLDKAPAGRVHDFVKVNGGHTVITKVSVIRTSCHYSVILTRELGSHRQQWSVHSVRHIQDGG